MGWTYPSTSSRKQLIAARIESWQVDRNDMTITTACLAHCFRGGRFSGVLWAVWEQRFTLNEAEIQPHERFITCDLIRCDQGEWGYKDMTESCGPFYYSCPLKYLEMVPSEHYEGTNPEWREEVRNHHRRQAEKRKARRLQKAVS